MTWFRHCPAVRAFRHWRLGAALAVAVLLSGCASFQGRDAPIVRVVSLQPLPGEGLELRFALKLRVQNPDGRPIAYNGVAVKLAVDGYGLASGVDDQQGVVPRYGESVLTVPVTVSPFAALRQLFARLERRSGPEPASPGQVAAVQYKLTGKLGADDGFNAVRFEASGSFGAR
ncbi:MAG: LEA type 2 family protein [Burkholderiaceae bacterium]